MKYLTGRPLGVWSVLLFSSALVFFAGCQKTPPTSNGNAKGYITSLDSGCSPSKTHGIWYNGVAAGTDSNYLEVTLNVTVPGKYDISTGSQNGKPCISHSASDPCVLQGGTCVAVKSCVPGQQLTVPIRATIVCGSKERYDVGMYIAQDGGDAVGNPLTIPHGGMCYRDYLHPVSSTNKDLQVMSGHGPYYNAEIGVVPTDTCGDIAQNQTDLYDFSAITITCRDDDHNGMLDVGTCLSWDINTKTTCNSEADTVPNSSSMFTLLTCVWPPLV